MNVGKTGFMAAQFKAIHHDRRLTPFQDAIGHPQKRQLAMHLKHCTAVSDILAASVSNAALWKAMRQLIDRSKNIERDVQCRGTGTKMPVSTQSRNVPFSARLKCPLFGLSI